MSKIYKVVDAFYVKESTVLVLDRKIDILDLKRSFLEDNGKKIPFSLTHNDFWVVVNGMHDLKNHSVAFC